MSTIPHRVRRFSNALAVLAVLCIPLAAPLAAQGEATLSSAGPAATPEGLTPANVIAFMHAFDQAMRPGNWAGVSSYLAPNYEFETHRDGRVYRTTMATFAADAAMVFNMATEMSQSRTGEIVQIVDGGRRAVHTSTVFSRAVARGNVITSRSRDVTIIDLVDGRPQIRALQTVILESYPPR